MWNDDARRQRTRTQVLLSSATGRAVLGTWPQYSDGAVGVDGSNRPHVHLNVLRYYLVRSSVRLLPSTLVASGRLAAQHLKWIIAAYGL